MRMLNLNVAVKFEYFALISEGKKNEEFRDITPYWVERLCVMPEDMTAEKMSEAVSEGKIKPQFKPYTHITFHCGTHQTIREITSIRVSDDGTFFVIEFVKQ